MIAIVDYGVGNLFSLQSSLRAVGAQVQVTGDAAEIRRAERVILPGVGAFGDAAEKLRRSGLDRVVMDEAKAGKPLLGICLGMQLLFEKSYEYGCHKGLGLIPGKVVPLGGYIPPELSVPHMGWNALHFSRESALMRYVREGDCVYFVHSYYATDCAESTIAVTDYGMNVTAAVQHGNVCGCQFHPEKSGEKGLAILRAFCEMGETV